MHVNAYRIAGLVPGSLSLILADHLPWGEVFAITALFMLPGLAMTLMVSEKVSRGGTPRTLREAVVEPFHEFLTRAGWREAALVLAFIFFYKLGDSLCTALATPFYLDMGFAKSEIGLVAKHAGLWPAVIGGLLGGLWMVKLGINRALWLFGVVQLVSIFGFAWLAWLGRSRRDWRGATGATGAGDRLRGAWCRAWARRPSSPSSPAPPIRSIRRRNMRCFPVSRRCLARCSTRRVGYLVE